MLMMFGHALYKAPFERAMPFNDRDLMILVSPEYGIRLCNITTEQGETFEIKSFMISKKDVFNCEDFDKRLLDFAEIFQGRVERFFVTKKSDYIFFDLEEQKFLRKLMARPGLSCSVEVYRYYKDKSPKRIDYLDIPHNEAMKITRFLNACGVKMIMTARDYYYMAKPRHEHTKDRQSRYQDFMKNKKEGEMTVFYKRYSKLKSLDSKERVDKYFKKLTIKYHPDRNIAKGGEDTTSICAQIREDFDLIKETTWYKSLKDKTSGGEQ